MEEVEEDTKHIVENVQLVEVKSKDEPGEDVVVRLTPTGKISHAKTRVYTQRYRKEWEHMSDFKDWLTSVPLQATRAFCKYCQRNLHAHRLSLLKHMCTLKHQRAAVQFNKQQIVFNEQPGEESSSDVNYIVESLDAEDDINEDHMDKERDNNEDDSMINESSEYINEEEANIEEDIQDDSIDESENTIEATPTKKMRLIKEEPQDALAQAMSHVHSDYLTENEDSIQLEMEVVSDSENVKEDTKQYEYIKCDNLKNQIDSQKDVTNKSTKVIDEITNEAIKTLLAAESKASTQAGDNSKKTYFFTTGGRTYSLVKTKPPNLINPFHDKNFTVVTKLAKNDVKNKEISNNLPKKLVSSNAKSTISRIASTSQEPNKNHTTGNSSSLITKSVLLKKPIVSTHVLETSKGVPVTGLQVSLYKLQDGRWTFIHESVTTANGNCNDFSTCLKNNLTTGRYKLHYDVEKYYNMRKIATIYPFIEIVFDIKDPNASYHIPLLVSPFSYSTFKDSHR